MFLKSSRGSLLAAALLLPFTAALAGGEHPAARADSHAPIGVMGDHVHKAGEFMASYRYMRMEMSGNRIGRKEVSPEFIVQNVPNRFDGPDTLRVVPTEMTMEMHMLGVMYGWTDTVTLMAMLPVVANSMQHLTFQGMSGIDRLGTFETSSEGIGDIGLSALFRVHDDGHQLLVGRLGLRAPTGSVDETAQVLTPMNTRPTLRMPYPMQLGSGTYAVTPALTWRRYLGAASIGAQYDGVLQLGRNDEGYTLGDQHALGAWAAYGWAPWVSTSLRARASSRESIQGLDRRIMAPIQTANPDFQGGDRIEAGVGVNLLGVDGPLRHHRLAMEMLWPFYQDLNGPQMETDYTLTVGYQYAW